MNVRLLVEYDGSDFAGWQRQLGSPTVQQTIEDNIRRITGEKNVLYAAGRTDSGVHARGQVCNFFTDYRAPADQWSRILNFFLPRTIRIVESAEVPASFHAQKDAQSKIYEYCVLNRNTASALDRRALFYPRRIDWEKIREALPQFLGEHDFKSFQGAKADVKSTVRTIYRFDLDESRSALGLYRFEIEGNGFLKQMVRAMVGTLLEIGELKRPVENISRILAERDRKLAGATAPPGGLTLLRVNYAL